MEDTPLLVGAYDVPYHITVIREYAMKIMRHIKKLARFLFGDYSIYYVYANDAVNEAPPLAAGFRFALVERDDISGSDNQIIADQAWYHGCGAHAYACLEGTRIVGLCFFWYGERYHERNFWPLADREAKLVQLITLPEMRGHGIASALIKYATQDMTRRGFSRVYARIWHSNTPSLRAFARAGWKRVATVIELNPFNLSSPHRITLGHHAARPGT